MSEVDSFINAFGGMTESYWFYDHTIELRYDVKNHVYLLVTPNGLEPQDGCTTVCHIIDKSNVLLPWGCKMMGQKLKVSLQPYLEREHYVGGSLFGGKYEISEQDFDSLLKESKSAHKDKLEDAGEVGHKAHAWIEDHIKSLIAHKDDDVCWAIDVPREDDRVTNCTLAALTWMTDHNVRWQFTERKIYSRTYKYAGTMDGLALVDSCNDPKCCKQQFKDHLAVIDWKTSNFLYLEYVLQTAAYRQAYQEETGEVIEDIFIVRLGKEDGEFEAWHVESELAAQGWDAFIKALWLKRSMAELEDLVGTLKDHRKQLEKAAKAAKKTEDLKVACKNSKKYKGVRKPTCNNGNPCETCLKRYTETQERIAKDLQNLVDKSENV